jgi:hypothetical protein
MSGSTKWSFTKHETLLSCTTWWRVNKWYLLGRNGGYLFLGILMWLICLWWKWYCETAVRRKWRCIGSRCITVRWQWSIKWSCRLYSVFKKNWLNFVRLYFLNLQKKILCCILDILLTTDAAVRLCARLANLAAVYFKKLRISSFKCYLDHSHTMYISGNIDLRNWVNLFNHPVFNLKIMYTKYFLLRQSSGVPDAKIRVTDIEQAYNK